MNPRPQRIEDRVIVFIGVGPGACDSRPPNVGAKVLRKNTRAAVVPSLRLIVVIDAMVGDIGPIFGERCVEKRKAPR